MLAALEIEESQLVVPGHHKLFPVRSEAKRPYRSRVFPQPSAGTGDFHRPDSDWTIAATGYHPPAVQAEPDGGNLIAVAERRPDLLLCPQVPQMGRAVVASQKEEIPIGIHGRGERLAVQG